MGRERELGLLRTLVPRAPGDAARVVLMSGEPGAGKTRLARELAAELSGEGVVVLYGACDTAVRVPYRPFVDALDGLMRRPLPEGLAEISIAELARVLPSARTLVGGDAVAAFSDPDTERHRLHLAIADLLELVSRRAPLLLVLEDIHWADTPTLLLLRHLARTGEARMLVVATYRDLGEVTASDLTDALIEIQRADAATSVRLETLTAQEISEFVSRNANVAPADELTSTITRLTGGNPFLVTELWRELLERHSLDNVDGVLRLTDPVDAVATPDSVRTVVGHRLERLSPAATTLMETAAVAGSEFELGTLRAVAGLEEPDLLDAVDETERSGLISETATRGISYRFSHELVRLAVIDGLSATRRATIHLRVAETLARRDPKATQDGRLAELAHHYAAAASVGGSEPAIRYSLLAARAAAAGLAFDESADLLRTAITLGIADPRDAAAAHLELGYVSHRAGKASDALAAFRDTAQRARELDDADLLARAAIGFEESCWRPGIHDGGSVALLREAAAALGSEDSELRARVLGGLGRALDLRGEAREAAAAADESIAMARRRGDHRALALTLAGAWARGASPPEEINAMLSEALAIGEELGDAALCAEVIGWLVPSCVSLCDHKQARRYLARLFEAASQQRQPFHLHVAEHYAAALALCDGDLAEAEAGAMRSHEWSRLLIGRDASGAHGIQMFNIRREQGRLAELMPVVSVVVARGDAAWGPGLAAILAELGMTTEAERTLRRMVFEEFDHERRSLWTAALVYLSDAATLVADETAAERLYEALAPHTGSNVVVGHLVSCFGAADRYLGMLATVLGEWDIAERHFEAASELNARLGAPTWLAHTNCEHARMLRRRGRPRDRREAEARLRHALTVAESLGLPRVAARARAEGAVAHVGQPPDSALSALSEREREVLRLIARGLSNRDIGASLFISEHTAASHVRSILRKTGCANRTEAAAHAHRRGLVD